GPARTPRSAARPASPQYPPAETPSTTPTPAPNANGMTPPRTIWTGRGRSLNNGGARMRFSLLLWLARWSGTLPGRRQPLTVRNTALSVSQRNIEIVREGFEAFNSGV